MPPVRWGWLVSTVIRSMSAYRGTAPAMWWSGWITAPPIRWPLAQRPYRRPHPTDCLYNSHLGLYHGRKPGPAIGILTRGRPCPKWHRWSGYIWRGCWPSLIALCKPPLPGTPAVIGLTAGMLSNLATRISARPATFSDLTTPAAIAVAANKPNAIAAEAASFSNIK